MFEESVEHDLCLFEYISNCCKTGSLYESVIERYPFVFKYFLMTLITKKCMNESVIVVIHSYRNIFLINIPRKSMKNL